MNNKVQMTRRNALTQAGLVLGTALVTDSTKSTSGAAESTAGKSKPFIFCLNTATIRGQKLGIVKELEIASRAGYDAVEPWVDSVDEYVKGGGSVKDLKQRIRDLGLTIESAIGFPNWIVDDDQARAKGMERAKYEMELVAQLGGKRLAAPPAGATNVPGLNLLKAAERYRALLETGDQTGVVPQLELWGFSKNLNRLGECACVAIESAHPKACVLIDVFHLYRGGSKISALKLLSGEAIHVVHMNDYPNDPPVERIDDSFRVYPGDGIAPITEMLQILRAAGGPKVLSLELFNRKLWSQDAAEVARIGLEKMKAAVSRATA